MSFINIDDDDVDYDDDYDDDDADRNGLLPFHWCALYGMVDSAQ